jgi:hypothetical protein
LVHLSGSWELLHLGLADTASLAVPAGRKATLVLSYGLYSGQADLAMLKAARDAAFKGLPDSVLEHF